MANVTKGRGDGRGLLSYEHDVFLSYKRSNNWPKYVEKHFLPMLRHWLDSCLGYPSSIFVDVNDIETGDSWPVELARGLSRSRTMVCLWTREYFSSPWCTTELKEMLQRRNDLIDELGPLPLILGVVLNDCEDLESNQPDLADIQRFDLKKYNNPWMAKRSPAAEKMSILVEKLAHDIAIALGKVPSHDPSWETQTIRDFNDVLRPLPIQIVPPSLG